MVGEERFGAPFGRLSDTPLELAIVVVIMEIG